MIREGKEGTRERERPAPTRMRTLEVETPVCKAIVLFFFFLVEAASAWQN
jgi:hypothetical protein